MQIEDKILPFMTLRQFVIVGAGGGFTYLIYLTLEHQSSQIWMPPVFVLGLLTVAVAFLRIRGISFIKFILLFLERYLNETKRVWAKSAGDISPQLSSFDKKKSSETKITKEAKLKASTDEVEKLSKMLDEGVKS
ncbi:PrgI family protein [Candidatus Gracilibacteria bacterium]|nr:PrgI family protein [Candidatus Gracilibacteria bacterium]